ncbi:tubulin-like doman-containing protein [Microbacterium sp. NPDC076895]|uniref:tubulin-like doman-containing protein n=1 Tax=Microbacterium sp. NPDC076895 TaxID=3154957 RepID=UPI0034303D91
MRKVLVVGCGGSGGATLGFMMDQLRAELAPYGIAELPAGWQFVHIDVPKSGDGGNLIATVAQQGGTYISTAPASGASYADVDASLSTKIAGRRELDQLGTWLPRDPEDIRVPVTVGAGQLRAVGRVLTLAQAPTVFEGLKAAWERLSSGEAEMRRVSDLAADRFGSYNQADDPIIFVVSSMAGGAGASMALDVCRILTGISRLDPRLMGVFMFSPDTFNELAPSARGGVRANGLAMLGEIVASQTGSASAHDAAVLSGLGVSTDNAAIPFARVFPVGRTMGVTETVFGDGTMKGLYRGLGRGLAGLISSDAALNAYVQYDLGNSNPTDTDRSIFGWGESSRDLQWGSFGFASLNMGRDRYRHYAAQRLARASVDRLVTGHKESGESRSDETILNALVDTHWTQIIARLQLPDDANHQTTASWLTTSGLRPDRLRTEIASIVDRIVRVGLPPAAGADAQQWLRAVSEHFPARRTEITTAVGDAVYRWAFEWFEDLETRLVTEITRAIEQYGLPYARAVLGRIQAVVQSSLLPSLQGLAGHPVDDPARLPASVATPLSGMKGSILNPDGVIQSLFEGVAAQLRPSIYGRAADTLARGLASMVSEVFEPLRAELSEALKLLTGAVAQPVTSVKLADAHTTIYSAWPSDENTRVPERFDVAHNEILLTPASGFANQYADDVRSSVGQGLGTGVVASQAALVPSVISGVWPVGAGEEPPGGLLERKAIWRASYFNTDPFTGEALRPAPARYTLHLSTAEILHRATAFVSRRGEPFDRYCSVSLQEFAQGDLNTPESEIRARHDLIVQRFSEALGAALPLIGVSEQAVLAVHAEGVSYRFKFSEVPLRSVSALMDRLIEVVRTWPNIDPTTVQDFDRAFTENAHATKVDVFGSYKCYSPIVFSGLLDPVKEEWGTTPSFGRHAFWEHRRSRPLRGSLPAGDAERRAMIAGWYIGRVTGRILVPGEPYSDPVQIWDPARSVWLAFAHPMLTPPSHFRGGDYDWLPAVLESQLLAIAHANNPPALSSLLPYRRLRELYDSSDQGMSSTGVGALASRLAGRAHLGEWLREGAVPNGGRNVFAGTTPTERAEAASAWASAQRSAIASLFTSPITNRQDAAKVPFFRDIAPDAQWALDEILRLMPDALDDARHGGDPVDDEMVVL